MNLQELTTKIKNGYLINEAEALEAVQTPDAQALYRAANEIRQHFCGNEFDTCSIINAKSGRCTEDCKWCAQSHKHHTGIDEYDWVEPQRAINMGVGNGKRGVKRFCLVTSGRKLNDSQIDNAVAILKEIGKQSDINLCSSMGLLSKAQLQRLKDAGIGHYHCNIETAPSFFPKLCTSHTIEEKLQTITWAKEIGLQVCSGGIIGMGETMAQRVEMAIFLQKIGVHSIPINILMPIKGTALENQKPLTSEEIFRTMAMFRLANPTSLIRMAGGRILYKNEQEQALHCGVNASIVGDMLTTTGTHSIEEDLCDFRAAGFDVACK
ncbi:MAG: biotin synthase BioB [Bacteroidales bacterium]|nr:biotin synthase BioB [Bacteroidales bacterium]